MNIFALSDNPELAAQMMVDSHVVKMILESAQLLSTAHRVIDGAKNQITKKWVLPDDRDSILYSATHINHPSAVWVRQSLGNYYWLFNHYCALGEEYRWRYGKTHKSMNLKQALCLAPLDFGPDEWKITPFAVAMPDEYKVPGDPVQSYRNYYKHGKAHLHKWTNRGPPEWML
jgi:hypothetical protein